MDEILEQDKIRLINLLTIYACAFLVQIIKYFENINIEKKRYEKDLRVKALIHNLVIKSSIV